MVLMKLYTLCFILFSFVFFKFSEGFQFDLESRSTKCFMEELPANFDVNGHIQAYPAYAQHIDFTVSNPTGLVVVEKRDIKKDDFTFKATVPGDHRFCFYNRLDKTSRFSAGLKTRIKFELATGTETVDYEGVARREDLKPVEVNLRMMEDSVKSILSEYDYLRKREQKMRTTNDSTHRRVQWIGLFSFVFVGGFAVGQVMYLKKFFRKKKII
eukprot:gb/GECH01012462.1/.p1 GENE.gb/GECH01012462.1/~~gb/GECH01012462.1/.p1  ORF type:complete len:213 (+),score=30.62 gb/GECH01012462.1/:1-639(+)